MRHLTTYLLVFACFFYRIEVGKKQGLVHLTTNQDLAILKTIWLAVGSWQGGGLLMFSGPLYFYCVYEAMDQDPPKQHPGSEPWHSRSVHSDTVPLCTSPQCWGHNNRWPEPVDIWPSLFSFHFWYAAVYMCPQMSSNVEEMSRARTWRRAWVLGVCACARQSVHECEATTLTSGYLCWLHQQTDHFNSFSTFYFPSF